MQWSSGLFYCNCNLNLVNVIPIVCYVCHSNVSFHIQVWPGLNVLIRVN